MRNASKTQVSNQERVSRTNNQAPAIPREKSAIYSMNKDFLIGPRDLFHSV
jgi:hypothetical protein